MKRLSLLTLMIMIMALGVFSSAAMAQNYEGMLRVYMVEPESRWTYDIGGQRLAQAMIDFAFVEALDIPAGSMVTFDTLWDASDGSGLDFVHWLNLEAVGAVFEADFVMADAYPNYGNWFELHEIDASASASHGVPGANVAANGMTHSVFCEEATATDCKSCPTMAANLHAAQIPLGTSMNYVALVEDMSAKAQARLEAELGGDIPTPTVFYDGGLAIQVGDTTLATMQTNISTVGARAVADVGLVIRLDHITDDQFQVVARVSNGVPANSAVTPDAPTGDNTGAALETFEFQASSIDGEDDDLRYQFDFGDGETSAWLGPFASGAACATDHIFATDGSYGVTVRTLDVWADTSAWSSEMPVTVDVVSDVNRRDSDQLPNRASLSNYPNPFNPSTVISFSLPRAGQTSLTIYNILGETVAHLVDDFLSAGEYEVDWDGTNEDGQTVTSGIYLYHLTAGDESLSRKMTLVK